MNVPRYRLWPDCIIAIGDWNSQGIVGTQPLPGSSWPDCIIAIGDWNAQDQMGPMVHMEAYDPTALLL